MDAMASIGRKRRRDRTNDNTTAGSSVSSQQESGTSAISLTNYTSVHQDALELEISIVLALLTRNRCSHERTKYYQRLSMATRSVLQSNSNSNESSLIDYEDNSSVGPVQLWKKAQALHDELATRQLAEKKKRKRQEVFWEIQIEKDTNDRLEKERQYYRRALIAIGDGVFRRVPEAISRLEHAADAFFRNEISRGFFLPFCTVAVAAMARIRALLVQMAYVLVTTTFPSLRRMYKDLFVTTAKSCSTKATTDRGTGHGDFPWGDEDFVRLQTFLHGIVQSQSQSTTSTTLSAAQLSKQSLGHLNLSYRKILGGHQQGEKPPSDDEKIDTGRNGDDGDGDVVDDDSHIPLKTFIDKELSTLELDEGEDDVGESFGAGVAVGTSDGYMSGKQAIAVDEDTDVPSSVAVEAQSSGSIVANASAAAAAVSMTTIRHHETDMNMFVLDEMRRKKKEKKERKEQKKKKRKKEKVSTKKRNDFFDELFGN